MPGSTAEPEVRRIAALGRAFTGFARWPYGHEMIILLEDPICSDPARDEQGVR